jgi:hypothetical protein
MIELWSTARHRVLKGDIIAGAGAIGCEVRNGSRSGATLRLSGAGAIPSAFMLQLDGGPALSCSVIRRSRLELGVRFVG